METVLDGARAVSPARSTRVRPLVGLYVSEAAHQELEDEAPCDMAPAQADSHSFVCAHCGRGVG